MINVNKTIFETIKDKFFKMRFLAEDNPKALKEIMYLIVLDDIYEWSDYLDDSQAVLKKLQELRNKFILCHPDTFIVKHDDNPAYVNVNTPQSNNTWKRVWDAPDVRTIDQGIIGDWEYVNGVFYTLAPFNDGELELGGTVNDSGILTKN